jgi:hypothetical protein
VHEFYSSRGETPRIDLCPLADGSLLRLLAESTYGVDSFYQVFLRSLDNLPPQTNPHPGMLVRPADPAEADLWILTTAQGFAGKEDPEPEVLDLLEPNFSSQNGVPFFAWVDGQPAGGGGMYLHEGVAELGGASTRVPFRHLGVQTALIAARLHATRLMGCDLAIVLTRPGSDSQRNVLRSGFELAYTKVILAEKTTASIRSG